MRRLQAESPFDVVHFWDVHFAFAYRGAYVASLHHSFRERLGTMDRDSMPGVSCALRHVYYSLARALAEAQAVRRARGLLAISATTRVRFAQEYGIALDSIALVRHGIDLGYFRPSPATSLRARLEIQEGEPVILFVGFVTPRKGLAYLARALPLMRPVPRLILAGRWSRGYRRQFYGLLGPVRERVIEAGFVPDEEMPAYYSLADVYVSASLLEGFGLPLAESLACGTPVVAANTGATAEVVGPGGVLVPARDPQALADAVSLLLGDPERRLRLGELGRQHVSSQFSLEAMLRDTLAAYQRFS